MCDALVEAAQQLTNIRLDDRPFVVFPSESLHRLDRVPGCGDDDFTFVPALSGHHLDLDKAIDRAETGEDRSRKMLAAVLLDTGVRSVPTPNANDLTSHHDLLSSRN